jgi:hypothetical protein
VPFLSDTAWVVTFWSDSVGYSALASSALWAPAADSCWCSGASCMALWEGRGMGEGADKREMRETFLRQTEQQQQVITVTVCCTWMDPHSMQLACQ